MALIQINGSTAIQPSDLKEEAKQKVVDRITIKGVQHRFWEAQKYQVTMTFSAINLAQYTTLAGWFLNKGTAVTYNNPNSGFTFTGYPTVAQDQYLRGASFLQNMTVTLVQQ